jgi:hypothetical protein
VKLKAPRHAKARAPRRRREGAMADAEALRTPELCDAMSCSRV